jgi:hypothetical protein
MLLGGCCIKKDADIGSCDIAFSPDDPPSECLACGSALRCVRLGRLSGSDLVEDGGGVGSFRSGIGMRGLLCIGVASGRGSGNVELSGFIRAPDMSGCESEEAGSPSRGRVVVLSYGMFGLTPEGNWFP